MLISSARFVLIFSKCVANPHVSKLLFYTYLHFFPSRINTSDRLQLYTDTDTDTANLFIVSSGVYIVKYIFKSWNNQPLKLSYKSYKMDILVHKHIIGNILGTFLIQYLMINNTLWHLICSRLFHILGTYEG